MTLKMPRWFLYVCIAVIVCIVAVLGAYYSMRTRWPSPHAATWLAAQTEAEAHIAGDATTRAPTNVAEAAVASAVAQTDKAIADTIEPPDDSFHFTVPTFGTPAF
jgi:hypothetical protein